MESALGLSAGAARAARSRRRWPSLAALGGGLTRSSSLGRGAAVLALALSTLALAACAGLRPLPSPRLAACPAGAPLDELWRCLDATDRETGAGVGAPQPRESAFQSTTRVTNGDLGRKRRDQRAARACGGPIPAGFVRWDAPAAASGRAPLHAYVHPPATGRATVIVVHGLYDSKHARYVRLTAELLAREGFGVLVPDMRFHGCLLSRDWLPTLGVEEGRDLVAWAGALRDRYPATRVGLIGFSLGALDVVHALAADSDSTGGAVFAAGGIAVSPPASLPLTLQRLDDPPTLADRGLQLLIGKFFQDALRTRMKELGIAGHERPFSLFLDWIVRQPGMPAGATPESFVAAGDPIPLLSRVRSPLLLIASRRDPIFAEGALVELRRGTAGLSGIHLLETTDGGHIGQIGRYPAWSAEVFTRFFGGGSRAEAGEP
jgi:predicted alpha/beta-fold hydrolase